MNEERLHGVAHRRALYFGVHTNPLRHLEGRIGIHVDMAYAFIVLDHRHFRMGDHGANQLLAAAWDDEINILFQLQQLLDESMLFRLNNLHRFLWHARLRASLAQDLADRLVREMRFTATPEDSRVA